jgi:hypothetical protein
MKNWKLILITFFCFALAISMIFLNLGATIKTITVIVLFVIGILLSLGIDWKIWQNK